MFRNNSRSLDKWLAVLYLVGSLIKLHFPGANLAPKPRLYLPMVSRKRDTFFFCSCTLYFKSNFKRSHKFHLPCANTVLDIRVTAVNKTSKIPALLGLCSNGKEKDH